MKPLGERSAIGAPARPAHELVHGRQVRAHLRGAGSCCLGGALGVTARRAGFLGGPLGGLEGAAALGGRLLQPRHPGPRGLQLLLEARQLALQALLAPGVEGGQLALDRGDAVLGPFLLGGQVSVRGGLLLEHLELPQPPLTPLARGRGLLAHPLEAHGDPLARRARRVQPRLEALAVARLGGERLLGLLAAPGDLSEQALGLVPLAAHAAGALLRLGQSKPGAARGVA